MCNDFICVNEVVCIWKVIFGEKYTATSGNEEVLRYTKKSLGRNSELLR